MRNAIAIEILVEILCPVVGSYSIVQRMVLYGDAIAHTLLPGLTLSFCWGIDIAIEAIHKAAVLFWGSPHWRKPAPPRE